MSALSCKPCCRRDEIANKSVVDNMIEIQDNYSETNKKSIKWVENLKCISFVSTSSRALHETRVPDKDFNELRDYVAVSYSCEPMEGESATPGGYTITNEGGTVRKNEVRDMVIFRACRFAEQVGSSLFWIDQECVDQGNERDKQMAMDSMDRVYSKSQHPVGLLWTELYEASHVCSLRSLLYGKLVRYSKRDGSPVLKNCNSTKVMDILNLLELLRKDRWWSRAWIFQEEYLGGQRMVLLVRHTQELEATKQCEFTRDRCNVVKLISGEICIPATQFREQATRFLLILREDVDISHDMLERCDRLLDCFRKYNVLYRDTPLADGKAMTSSVFADIEARDVGRPYDFLPIAANSCDYAVRLDSQALSAQKYPGHSVGLCALTMSLVNGELIIDAARIKKDPTAMNTSAYLDYVLFREFDPPVDGGQLTWLKRCRLPNVRLCQDGIHTNGLLWRVYDHFEVAGWPHPEPTTEKRFECGLHPDQRARLTQLAGRLRRAERHGKRQASQIPYMIESYLSQDDNYRDWDVDHPSECFDSWGPSEAKEHQDTMAGKIVHAIDDGHPVLSLAVLEGSDKAFAIFVGNHRKGTPIFTSWSNRLDEDQKLRTRHVYLKVAVDNIQSLPRMRILGWVNGLTFWEGHRPKKAVFTWPVAWERKICHSRKRMREVDSGLE